MNFLLKDLIKPNEYPFLDDMYFHKDIKKIFKGGNTLFDTILYGASGSGKLTLLFGYLQEKYSKNILKLVPNNEYSSSINDNINYNEIENEIKNDIKNDKDNKSSFSSVSSSSIYIPDGVGVPLSNQYLILINDSVNDDTLIELIKKQITMLGENINYILILHIERFKPKTISWISNFIDNRKSLTYILATSNRFNAIPSRLKSRFETIKVSRPREKDLINFFHKLIPSKFNYDKDKISKIINQTSRDIKLSIIYINQKLLENIEGDTKKKSLDSFKYYLGCLIQLIILNDLKNLQMIRSMILTLYQSAITWKEYIKKTVNFIIINYNNLGLKPENKTNIITQIIHKTAELDQKVSQIKPNYSHYEAFIFMIYYTIIS